VHGRGARHAEASGTAGVGRGARRRAGAGRRGRAAARARGGAAVRARGVGRAAARARCGAAVTASARAGVGRRRGDDGLKRGLKRAIETSREGRGRRCRASIFVGLSEADENTGW
jgi:ATP-dependent RNA helicase DeaD